MSARNLRVHCSYCGANKGDLCIVKGTTKTRRSTHVHMVRRRLLSKKSVEHEESISIMRNLTIALRRRIPGEDSCGETVGDATVLMMADNWLEKQKEGYD